MSSNIVSPEEAGLILHRLVTEQISIVAFFIAGDGSVRATVRGRVNSFTQEKGLAICTPFTREKPIPAALEFPHDLIALHSFGIPTKQKFLKTCQSGRPSHRNAKWQQFDDHRGA
jgi:hypothetical protein